MKIDISCRLGIRPDFQPTFCRGGRPAVRIPVRILALGLAGGLLLAGCVAEPPQQRTEKLSDLDRSLFQAAESFEKRRDYVTAVSYYRNLYRRDQADIEAVVGLSRGLRHLQQAREAQAIVLRALKKTPKDRDLRAELGKVLLSLGEPLKAIDQLSRVDAEIEGKRWDIKVALAIGHDRVGMYEQAERRYRQALELSPENAAVMNNFALSLAQAGCLGEALELLQRAASLPEATPRMRQNLALLFAMKGDLASAEKYVRRDMPPKVAAQNMAYYRQLRDGMSGGAAPAISAAAPPAQMAAKPSSEKLAPVEVVASEDAPARRAETTQVKDPAKDPSVETAAAPVAQTPAKPEQRQAEVPAPAPASVPVPAQDMADAKADDGTSVPEAAPATATATASTPDSSGKVVEKVADQAVEKPAVEAATASGEGVKTAAVEADEKPVQAAEGEAVTPRPVAEEPEKAGEQVAALDNAATTPSPEAESSNAKTDATEPEETEVKSPEVALAPVVPEGYRLQLGSFKSLDGAETLRLKLLEKHGDLLNSVDLVVETVTVPERGDFFRVNSRPVPDREMVDETCLKLAIRDVPCLLVRAP